MSRPSVSFQGFEMHPGQSSDNLQMAEFLGPDIHKKVLPIRVIAVQALDLILHGCGKLPVGPAELLQQHISEARVWHADPDGIH